MKKNTRWLLTLCISAVAGVFLLQFFWIKNYYFVNKATFEKEVNLAFEDAVIKEFEVRCDTIEKHIFQRVTDSNEYLLSNIFDNKKNTLIFWIKDAKKPSDHFYFHSDSLLTPVAENDHGPAKTRLAKFLSHEIRQEDMPQHIILYRTQRLGQYIQSLDFKYSFDTVRLRSVFNKLLSQRGIHVPFVFYTRSTDSIYNVTRFKAGLLNKYPVITTAHPTYTKDKNQNYVRAMFTNPASYIIGKMWMMFLASLVLIVVVAFSLFYLLRSLLTEKKLALIKNDFISNITHELKTPIATVSAAVESLSDFNVLEDKEKTNRYLSHSKNELQRLSNLVNTILTSTLYENPAFECNYEQLDVNEAISIITQKYQNGIGQNTHITWQNSAETHTIRADRMLFGQSLENIIDNSVKYGGQNVQIDINCTAENGFFVIKIKDNGEGIAKENLPFLFEKFYRVPNNMHKVKGHGLGLNFVKNIMDRHKGWYRVESVLGKGTTVILGWPA